MINFAGGYEFKFDTFTYQKKNCSETMNLQIQCLQSVHQSKHYLFSQKGSYLVIKTCTHLFTEDSICKFSLSLTLRPVHKRNGEGGGCILPVQQLVRKIGEVDTATEDKECSASIFMHFCSGIEALWGPLCFNLVG